MTTRQWIIAGIGVAIAAAVVIFVVWPGGLDNRIVFPYISHQKPLIDPHLPAADPLSDKLDEVQFDGLFNISANPSGITYEDGLGSLIGIDEKSVVTVKLRTTKKWHDSYNVKVKDEDEVLVRDSTDHFFSPEDLRFTLNRIKNLGSLSPDYILVSQALKTMDFEGPDENGFIRFPFKEDRIWTEPDIKEVLSFKVLPEGSDINALNYRNGTAAYLSLPQKDGVSDYYKTPEGPANVPWVILNPFIDNSTFTTELSNDNINVLLETPYGAISPILGDKDDYFYKPSLSTTFFAVLFNTDRLNLEQRQALRSILDNKKIIDRFYLTGTEQQRNIVNFRGERNDYDSYLNKSIFPTSSYYVAEDIVIPAEETGAPSPSVLPDSVRLVANLNYGFREELSGLLEILNDPNVSGGKIKAVAVQNDDIKSGNYDALLIPFSGYRSNFLFDLYEIFMREPDLSIHKINLSTTGSGDNKEINSGSWNGRNNFFRLNAIGSGENSEDIRQLLDYIYGFMSTREIGDKQAYAMRIDRLENKLALGEWLFSLPSLSYFNTQFDSSTIDIYGVTSQLSTIEKWKEKED